MAKLVQVKTWDGESPWKYAHVKRDGIWLTLRDGTAYTRMPTRVGHLLKWHPTMQAYLHVAPDLTFYCEAWVEGGSRDDVKAAMRDEDPRLTVEVFAVPHLGEDAPLEVVREYAEGCAMPFVPFVMPPHDLAFTPSAAQEGWVLKDGNLSNWRKVKPQVAYDLLCSGMTEGKGKYEGTLGALELEWAGGEVAGRCSGMTDAQRREFWGDPTRVVGKVVEVECQGLGSAGGLMHPRFLRVRDDKDGADVREVAR